MHGLCWSLMRWSNGLHRYWPTWPWNVPLIFGDIDYLPRTAIRQSTNSLIILDSGYSIFGITSPGLPLSLDPNPMMFACAPVWLRPNPINDCRTSKHFDHTLAFLRKFRLSFPQLYNMISAIYPGSNVHSPLGNLHQHMDSIAQLSPHIQYIHMHGLRASLIADRHMHVKWLCSCVKVEYYFDPKIAVVYTNSYFDDSRRGYQGVAGSALPALLGVCARTYAPMQTRSPLVLLGVYTANILIT